MVCTRWVGIGGVREDERVLAGCSKPINANELARSLPPSLSLSLFIDVRI